MVLVFALCLFLLGLTPNCCSGNETIDSYMSTENTFINDLESYIESQESVLQLLRKKLLNFKVEHSEAFENPESYFTNELNKFLLVKRLSSDINLISDKTYDVASRFKSKVGSYKNEKALPSKDDLKASALSIAKLQKDQSLRTDKLAKGIFGDIKRRNGLSTEDCYQLGRQLNSAHVYLSATEWLTEAMKRYDEYYDQHQVKALEILEELALSFIGSNQIQEAKKIVDKVSRMNAESRVVKYFKSHERQQSWRAEEFPSSIEKNDNENQCHLNIHLIGSDVLECPT